MYANNVELSEPLTSEGAIIKSPKRIAEVQAVARHRVRHSDKTSCCSRIKAFFRGHRPHRARGLDGRARTRQLQADHRAHCAGRLGSDRPGALTRERIFRAALN